MKRCVLLLLAVGCGGSTGEIDLLLLNKTSSNLVVQESDSCGASHLQILDASGPVGWSCGEGTKQTTVEAADFAPMFCPSRVRSIRPDEGLSIHWDGLYRQGDDCNGTGESFTARFCFGTRSSTQMSTGGVPEQVIDDLRCESVPFQLGVDLEARYVVE